MTLHEFNNYVYKRLTSTLLNKPTDTLKEHYDICADMESYSLHVDYGYIVLYSVSRIY